MITKQTMSESIKTALKTKGYEIVEPTSKLKMFGSEVIDAIAEGVVNELKANAEINVSSGSSAGTYKIS